MSKVIVDREDFKYALRCARSSEGRLRGPTLRRLLAALDRDPDALTEQVAKAIYEAGTDSWTTGGYRYSHNHPYEALTSTSHEHYERQARAALAAITGEGN